MDYLHRKRAPARHKTDVDAVGHVSAEEIRVTRCRQYCLGDMLHATHNFNDRTRLGEGASSVVYRGGLPDGTIVAIKRMKVGVLSKELFESEIEVLSGLHHLNLVSLLGYCVDGNERILIYEYVEGGTLERYIFKHRDHKLQPLAAWHRRLLIALDVARAMEYLHSLNKLSVVHRDLKPGNILLDKKLRAKVADFGLLKVISEGQSCAHTTHLKGTFGYIAPECALDPERVSTAMDVYSFGIILEILITGKKSRVRINGDMHALAELFQDMCKSEDAFLEGIDAMLKVTPDSTSDWLKSICTVATLALQCTVQQPKSRPHMRDIVLLLAQLVGGWKGTSLREAEERGDHVNQWRQVLEHGHEAKGRGHHLNQWCQILEHGHTSADLLGRASDANDEHPPTLSLGFTDANSNSLTNGTDICSMTVATTSGFTDANSISLTNGMDICSMTATQWRVSEYKLIDKSTLPTDIYLSATEESQTQTSYQWAGHYQDATAQFAAANVDTLGVDPTFVGPFSFGVLAVRSGSLYAVKLLLKTIFSTSGKKKARCQMKKANPEFMVAYKKSLRNCEYLGQALDQATMDKGGQAEAQALDQATMDKGGQAEVQALDQAIMVKGGQAEAQALDQATMDNGGQAIDQATMNKGGQALDQATLDNGGQALDQATMDKGGHTTPKYEVKDQDLRTKIVIWDHGPNVFIWCQNSDPTVSEKGPD